MPIPMTHRRIWCAVGIAIATLSMLGYSSRENQERDESHRVQQVRFLDIARRAGLNTRTVFGGELSKKFIIETTGGGVAFFDYDNDGWLDIFLVNGSRLESLAADAADAKPTNHLYRNNRNGTFSDVTTQAGL